MTSSLKRSSIEILSSDKIRDDIPFPNKDTHFYWCHQCYIFWLPFEVLFFKKRTSWKPKRNWKSTRPQLWGAPTLWISTKPTEWFQWNRSIGLLPILSIFKPFIEKTGWKSNIQYLIIVLNDRKLGDWLKWFKRSSRWISEHQMTDTTRHCGSKGSCRLLLLLCLKRRSGFFLGLLCPQYNNTYWNTINHYIHLK